MAGFVRSLGLSLVDRGGKPFDAGQFSPSDVVAFYFSAHWCPPCRQFTPMLKRFAETLESHGETSLKIIFVSSDKTEKDMWEYMYSSHGNWLCLAFGCAEGKERLSRHFQVSGIPALVVVDQVGRSCVRDARSDVMSACSSSSTQVLAAFAAWRGAAGAAPSSGAGAAGAAPMLQRGARVRIKGLKGAPENNGLEASVDSYDGSKSRYVVELREGGKKLSLRAANLLQLTGVRILLAEGGEWIEAAVVDVADDAAPEGEDLVLSCAAVDAASAGDAAEASVARHPVRLQDPERAVLQAGCLVGVHGLQAEAARHWNEHNGKVLSFDAAAGRYLVEMAPSSQIKIRPANMRLHPLY